MKLEIIALLICTIMGRTRRRRRVHHDKGEDSKGVAFSSYDTVEGVKQDKPEKVEEVPAATGEKRFMKTRWEGVNGS